MSVIDGGVVQEFNTVIDRVRGEVLLRLESVISSVGFRTGSLSIPFSPTSSELFEAKGRR